jgi:hypothetical protein
MMAVHAGLTLTDEELQKLLPGVIRSRKQVAELRQLLSDTAEPAGSFAALKGTKVLPP